jgi:site-specific DNA-methyltransferase (adenine-specific)
MKNFISHLIPVPIVKTTSVISGSTKNRTAFLLTGGGNVVFCNPPYSEIEKWVAKAFYESRKDNAVVVLLIPARTDTKYFHNYILHRSEIRFVKGRLKFGNQKNAAPFPSMVIVFRGANIKERTW